MDWIKNLNRALEYIEENITDDLDHAKIANAANSSKFHFIRIFSILTGKTLGEYIRERRLSLASQDILHGDLKVIDVALKYGYEDAGAFSKAFKRFHGVTPTQAQCFKKSLKAVPPLKFIISVKGDEKVDYRIEKKGSFNVIGVSTDVTLKNGKNFEIIPKFWQESIGNGVVNKALEAKGELGIIGVIYDYNEDAEEFKYMIGTDSNNTSETFSKSLKVDAHDWAIFSGKGDLPKSMQAIWEKIFNEWFPATNYQHADGPELEVYRGPDNDGNEQYEIWIPVEIK